MISIKQFRKIQVVLTILCTVLVIAGVLFAYHAGYLRGADNSIFDLHVRWRGPVETSDKIVLVLMDDKSSKELGRTKGTFPRRYYTEALTNLCQAGTEIIGLDVILSAADTDPQVDIDLANAIYDCNNVVLARVSSLQGVGEISPLPLFQEAMIGDGFIDVPLDQDEILRKIRFLNAKPLEDGALQLFPSFSLELARTYLNLDFQFDFSEEDHFLLGAAGEEQLLLPYPELLINYHGDFTAFPRLSYVDVVKNRFAPEAVQGKLVLIGSSIAIQKDFFRTPFTRFATEKKAFSDRFKAVITGIRKNKDLGVSCHAHAVETILSQRFIYRIDKHLILSMIVLLGIASVLFYLPALGMMRETFVLCGITASIVFASHFSFQNNLVWVDIAPLLAVLFFQFIVGVSLQKVMHKKKTAMVTDLFGKYQSPSVVNKLVKGDIEIALEGQHKELSMLFSDIRSFTTLSEELGAKDTGRLLNVYFDAMIPIVFEHEGTLDKLMGDAVMAFYGSPADVPEHPAKAAITALEMLKKLESLRKLDVPGIERLAIGIGLNTGEVTVGNLGSYAFMDYTIIGDAVNLASRLEGLNKVYRTQILITEFTAERLDARFLVRELDLVRVKGKHKAIALFELVGYSAEIADEKKRVLALFEAGLAAYRNQEWARAESEFAEALEIDPKDGPSLLYIERAHQMKAEPPVGDWDGVTTFGHK